MSNLLDNLNPEQLQAVKHQNGPLLIVAGAGTGKTTVITRRLAYLIEQKLAGPEEILALTFTEKAAGEMVERVEALLPYGYFDLWISTFHGFAERILKEHGLAIGLPADFKLFNEFQQWALVKKNLDKFDLDYYRPLGNPTKFIHALLKHFSRAKDEGINPREYLEYAEELKQNLDGMLGGGKKKFKILNLKFKIKEDYFLNIDSEMDKGMLEQETSRILEVANAYHVYQQLLLDNNALDFGDLINYCLKLFYERPAILQQYRHQFKYILLDEFQDTNWAQYELIKILAAPKNNLVVVGDDDQSIYKFRGASLSNILQFNKDYPAARKIFLTRNYRSEQNILDLAYEFIKQNNPNRLEWRLESQKSKVSAQGGSASGRKSQKLNKKLIAENDGQGAIEVIDGRDLAEEARLVVDKIVELKNVGANGIRPSWNDFAILVRANDSAREWQAELERRGLPYIFGAARGLYLKPVIMDVIAYFKLLDNYHESAAVWRILNLPIYNFTDQELANFNYWASRKAWSLFEVLNQANILQFCAELQEKIKPILALIAKHSALAREKPASEVFLAFMNDSGYLKYLAGGQKVEQKSRESLGLLNQFLKRIQAFESSADDPSASLGTGKTVKAFLAELNLELEAGEVGTLAVDLDVGPEAIKILTVHGAKGLEFPYVFITNLVDKRFPTVERSEQINLPDALIKEILPEGDVHLEEERRLFYVAMTRAKRGLYFSWARDYGGKAEKKPSRFLMELKLVKEKTVKDKGLAKLRSSPISNFQFPISNKIPNSKLQTPNKFQMQVPAYFSYSQLAAYSSCPYQYRFAHVLKIPVMGKEQFSFGKTLHATLYKLFTLINEKKGLGQGDLFGPHPLPLSKFGEGGGVRGGVVTLEEILKLYEQSWIDDWYESKKKKQERKKQGQEILKVFYEKYKNNWPNVLFLEKGFNLKVAKGAVSYTVRGVIDRVDQSEAGLKLVDYKTGQAKKDLFFEEKEQLLIYQLAAEELFKEKVAILAYYYLDNNSEVEFIGSPGDLEKIKTKIVSTIEKIRQGEFPPRPSRLCAYCDFRGICEFRE